jgi:hypothetical protein
VAEVLYRTVYTKSLLVLYVMCVMFFSYHSNFAYLTQLKAVCFKLCHVKDKNVKKITVLRREGGNKLENKKEGGEGRISERGFHIEFQWPFPRVYYILRYS